MPEARVPCESCPWTATSKRPAGARIPEDTKREAASGIALACTEDGGTCYGAVRFAMSADADTWRGPPVARGQGPDTPDRQLDFTTPTTAVDFVPTPPSELED